MSGPDIAVLTLFATGVDAVVEITAGFDDEQWAAPVCGDWSGTELAGHLVTVVGWYHDWLDRGLAGNPEPVFPIAELDARAAAALAALPPGSGPDRIEAFADSAERYVLRLADHWDVPFGYPRGTVTAGLHAGVAAVEWHVHAWDLAHAVDVEYVPADADVLFVAAARCQMAMLGGFRGRAGVRAAKLAARRNPWEQLLQHMGRT
jgi:uncharacterized protein (TIGR03083 family)